MTEGSRKLVLERIRASLNSAEHLFREKRAERPDVLMTVAPVEGNPKELAEQFGHLTAKQSAQLALDAGVGSLILTHISRRYRTDQIRDEARAVFPGTFVAKDFDRFQIKRGEVEKVED